MCNAQCNNAGFTIRALCNCFNAYTFEGLSSQTVDAGGMFYFNLFLVCLHVSTSIWRRSPSSYLLAAGRAYAANANLIGFQLGAI